MVSVSRPSVEPKITWSSCQTQTESQVVSSLMGAAYGSAGELAAWRSRVAVCVGDEVADKLVNDLRTEIAGMKVGAGMDSDEPHMGLLVTREHADKVLGYINQGVFRGATLVVDGRRFCGSRQ